VELSLEKNKAAFKRGMKQERRTTSTRGCGNAEEWKEERRLGRPVVVWRSR
jgi:hypothetical protein